MRVFLSFLALSSLHATHAIRIRSLEYEYDWEYALTNLTAEKALWESNDITRYVYQFTTSCYCDWCDLAPKYITVNDGVVTDAEFVNVTNECGADELADFEPFSSSFKSISAFYDEAIAFAQYGMDVDCSRDNVTDEFDTDEICGGSITFTVDASLHFPTLIALNYGPTIADADKHYTFGSLLINEGGCDSDSDCPVSSDPYCGYDCFVETGECQMWCHDPPYTTERATNATTTQESCVCTENYIPYCCDDSEQFSNECYAACQGYNVTATCFQEECTQVGISAAASLSVGALMLVVMMNCAGFM